MSDPIRDASARKGSAEVLVLAALETGERHGYDLSREIARRSGGVLTFRATSLYPALYRLEDRGLIVGRWRRIDERRRRCYRLTAEGRAALARQRTRWSAFVRALRRAAGLRHA